MAVTIVEVQPGSPAYKAGLRAGMQLLSIDGHDVWDGIDYEFYAASRNPLVCARAHEDEAPRRFSVKKEETQELGCLFDSYLISPQQRCQNRCQFCFIDQLPKGLRPSLYFKDDDERLGFLFGNYVTLTNLGEREIERIIEMRISPVNVSVHTSNPRIRCEMMGNKKAGEVLSFLPRLAKADIALNTQLVLCPGINDGAALCESIEWLETLYPALQSIAAVPVGLTRYREGLVDLKPYTKEEATEQLDIMLSYGERFLKKYGERLVYPSDEWFLLSERPIPPSAFYEDFPQLENGVGMWRTLHDEFIQALSLCEEKEAAPAVDIATGVLAAPLMRELAQAVQKRFPKAQVYVHEVKNEFFGPNITVAGLLTGQDLLAALQGKLRTSRLLISKTMLRSEGDLFLCGKSVEALSAELGTQVVVCDAYDLFWEIIEN